MKKNFCFLCVLLLCILAFAVQAEEPEPTSPEYMDYLMEELPANQWLELQDYSFTVHNPGVWAELVDDEDASDYSAAKMPGDHLNWAVQCRDRDLENNTWHCYVVARFESKAKRGRAFSAGIYDNKKDKGITQLDVMIEKTKDGEKYRVYDLGVHKIPEGGMFYFFPSGDKAVEAVYIDRIFLVKEK